MDKLRALQYFAIAAEERSLSAAAHRAARTRASGLGGKGIPAGGPLVSADSAADSARASRHRVHRRVFREVEAKRGGALAQLIVGATALGRTALSTHIGRDAPTGELFSAPGGPFQERLRLTSESASVATAALCADFSGRCVNRRVAIARLDNRIGAHDRRGGGGRPGGLDDDDSPIPSPV